MEDRPLRVVCLLYMLRMLRTARIYPTEDDSLSVRYVYAVYERTRAHVIIDERPGDPEFRQSQPEYGDLWAVLQEEGYGITSLISLMLQIIS